MSRNTAQNADLANMAQATIKGRAAEAGSGVPVDLTAAQVGAIIATELSQFPVDINRCGFLNQTETSISFDGTNTFTLGDAGAGWTYYRAGVRHTISGSKTVTLSATPPAAAATYYVYIDDAVGTLSVMTTSWTLKDSKIPVAIVFWNNGLTPKYVLADERHTILIDRRTHLYEHLGEGTKYISGGALSSLASGDNLVDKRPTIAEAVIMDEDIIHTLSILTPSGAPYTAADFFLTYKIGGAWAWKLSDMPFPYNIVGANNIIQYDNGTTLVDTSGGVGSNARWVNSYLLMTNQLGAARFTWTPGRAEFTSLALAQAENPLLFNWAGLNVSEATIAWQVTWKRDSVGYTTAGKCVYAGKKAIGASISTSPASGGNIDHNTLNALQGGTAGEYYHLTSADVTRLANTSGTNTGDQSVRVKLTTNTTYYVATTGNNSNPGTSGSPWATIQYAYDYIASNIDLAGYTITIQLADGAYTAGLTISSSWTGGGNITIQGNTGNSSSVTLTTTSASNFVVNASLVGVLTIQYMKLKTITSGDCIQHNNTGTVKYGNVVFDACARYHLYAAYAGASIVSNASYSVIGGCSAHIISESAAMIRNYGYTITVTGNFTVSLAWAYAASTANIQSTATYSVTGTITGSKYFANSNAVIYKGSGTADYFPGSVAGSYANGGQYV